MLKQSRIQALAVVLPAFFAAACQQTVSDGGTTTTPPADTSLEAALRPVGLSEEESFENRLRVFLTGNRFSWRDSTIIYRSSGQFSWRTPRGFTRGTWRIDNRKLCHKFPSGERCSNVTQTVEGYSISGRQGEGPLRKLGPA